MSQVTIYLDETTEKDARVAAEKQGVSLSRFIAEAVRRRLVTEWPPDVAAMLGDWADEPEDLLAQRAATDVPREPL